MTRWGYFKYCFSKCWRGPNAIAQSTSLIITIVAGIVVYRNPDLVGQMTILLWAIPLAVFAATFIVAWAFAPFPLLQNADRLLKQSDFEFAKTNQAEIRLENVRSVLLQHANESVNEGGYTKQKGYGWCTAAAHILQESVKPTILAKFWFADAAYEDHRRSVASLRSIASNLQVEDLA